MAKSYTGGAGGALGRLQKAKAYQAGGAVRAVTNAAKQIGKKATAPLAGAGAGAAIGAVLPAPETGLAKLRNMNKAGDMRNPAGRIGEEFIGYDSGYKRGGRVNGG